MPFDCSLSLPLHLFAGAQAGALLSAANLLGGDPGRRRCARLLSDLFDRVPLNRRLVAEVRWLIGLLGLEHVGDPDRIETDLFSQIAPEDPVVEDICRLHDALLGALAATEAEARVAV